MSTKHHIPESNNPSGGFEMPEGYFEASRRQVLMRIQQGGFDVPKDYFEESRRSLIVKTASRPTKSRIIKLHPMWYAAAALLVASITWLVLPPTQLPMADSKNISDEDIINYVVQHDVVDVPVSMLVSTEHAVVSEQDIEIANQLDEETLLNEL